MAKANKILKYPIVAPPYSVTLTLSQQEAEHLKGFLGGFNEISAGSRTLMDIYDALTCAEVPSNVGTASLAQHHHDAYFNTKSSLR